MEQNEEFLRPMVQMGVKILEAEMEEALLAKRWSVWN